MLQKIKAYLTHDIWRIRLKSLPGKKSLLIHHLRVILLALRGFAEDKCQLRASALTFFSLLSVVPVAAMAFGIAKGFGFEKMLEDLLLSKGQGQEEVVSRIIEFSQSLLENTKGGLIAGIGVVLLFWTVIKVLGNIELSFNDIWGVKTARSLVRKFSDYLAIMLICPMLLIFASSMTVFITSQIAMITEKIAVLGIISPLIFFLLKFIPYCVLWLLFSFIYIVMPNTRVNVSSGIFAGIIAGTIYQVVQWVYITFQLGASKYGAIYGSFAALPLFLIWLQLSWLVVLFGAEISFAHQNVETYEFEPDCLSVSISLKRRLSLRIMYILIKRFVVREKPLTAEELSHELEIPIRLMKDLLYDLVQAGLLAELKTNDIRISSYQPGCDPDVLSVKYINDALDTYGSDTLPLKDSREYAHLEESFNALKTQLDKSPANTLLKNM